MRVGAVGQLLGIGDTGLDRDGLTAVILDVDDQLLGSRAVAAVVDDHAGIVGGQPGSQPARRGRCREPPVTIATFCVALLPGAEGITAVTPTVPAGSRRPAAE